MLLPLCLFGCGAECADGDGDGYGPHCEAGPDCDDTDPTRALNCERPPSDCEADPEAVGCPCIGGNQACYDGAPETIGVSTCVEGRRRCAEGRWTECRGAVLPGIELCNGDDDDCDGRVDERVQSPCGGCDNTCMGDVWGTEAAPFAAGPGLALTAAAELTLAHETREAARVWVPNADATLSKLDAFAAVELARYRLPGAEPTRIATDYPGDAWVLSPDPGGPSMLAHVAARRADCIGGDAAQTSSGPDDLRPIGQDDCLLLSVEVGGAGETALALAIDGQLGPDGDDGGHPWVAFGSSERVAELDPDTGAELRSVDVPGLTPHVAIFDAWGRLWIASRDGLLAQIDLASSPPEVTVEELPVDCFNLEALTADPEGVLYLTGFSCENVLRYDPVTHRVIQRHTEGLRTTRGIALLDDALYVAHTAGELSQLSLDPLSFFQTYPLSSEDVTPLESIGVAADSHGQVWVVSTQGGPDGSGVATRFDPESATVSAQVPVGPLPRALGDFTGYQLFGAFEPEANARHVFQGCRFEGVDQGDDTDWQQVHLQTILGPGASVAVRARHATTPGALADAEFVTVGESPQPPPYPLDFPDGGYVEVELTLRAALRTGAPRVQTLGVEWRCPGPQ